MTRHPNGTAFDINIGGFDVTPTLDQVMSLSDKIFGPNTGILKRSYSSDYVDASEYKQAIRGLHADAGSRAKIGHPVLGNGDLAGTEKAFQALAKKRDSEFKAWNTRVEARRAAGGAKVVASHPA